MNTPSMLSLGKIKKESTIIFANTIVSLFLRKIFQGILLEKPAEMTKQPLLSALTAVLLRSPLYLTILSDVVDHTTKRDIGMLSNFILCFRHDYEITEANLSWELKNFAPFHSVSKLFSESYYRCFFGILFRISFCLSLAILPTAAMAAVDYTWTGNCSHNWFDKTNCIVPPAVFSSGPITGNNWRPFGVELGLPTNSTPVVNILSGIVLIQNGHAFGGRRLNISGGDVTLGNNAILTGQTEQINGTFRQSGSSVHSVSDLAIGINGNYVLSGGQLKASNIINNGTFNQSGGSISGFGTKTLTFINNRLFNYSSGSFNGNLINNGTSNFDPSILISFDDPGGTIKFSTIETFGATISGGGRLNKVGGGTLILTGQNSNTGNWTVSGGVLQGNSNSLKSNITNNATVVFDQAINGSYEGAISGTGNLIKRNTGLLTLNGINTYTGGTEVAGGNLQVGDANHTGARLAGPVTIDPAGTLSGHGTINGSVFNNGTLAPGGSIGTLNVTGNVTFAPNSTFNVEISPTQASLLNVGGTAALNNAGVRVLADKGNYTTGTSYTILQANRGVQGTFNNVFITNAAAIPSLQLLTPNLQFFKDHVNLRLDSEPDPRTTVDRKIPKHIFQIITGRLNAPLGEDCPQNSLGFWARGLGMVSNADASGNAPAYNGGTAGSIFGFDGNFIENLSLGITGYSTHSDVVTHGRFDNHSSSDSAGGAVYGTYTPGAWQIKGAVSYQHTTDNTQRTLGVARVPIQAVSKSTSQHVNSYTEASYTFKSHNLALQPVMGLQLGWMRQDGATEKGAESVKQNLSLDGRTLYTFDTLFGLRTRYEWPLSYKNKMQFELRTYYDHDFGTLHQSVASHLSDGQLRLLSSADRPAERDAGIIGASISFLTLNALNFYLDYNGEIRGGQQSHFINAGVRFSW